MKKRYIILTILFVFFSLLFVNTKCKAVDLDRITNYEVTVEPRMNDGSLDITYEITWQVLNSIIEGPLTWVKIGTPNEYFDTPTALSNNIKKVSKYSGSYVRIDFDRAYEAGESVTFKYSIHQKYMHKVSWGKCKYEFTPAWFTDIGIDKLTIKWNCDEVISSNKARKEGNYLVWEKTNMPKGQKLTAKIKYNKSAFSNLSSEKISQSENTIDIFYKVQIIVYIIICIIIPIFFRRGRRILPDIEDFMVDIEVRDVFTQAVHVLILAVLVVALVLVLEAEELDALKRISMELI